MNLIVNLDSGIKMNLIIILSEFIKRKGIHKIEKGFMGFFNES